jgi:hypothetical protein
LEWWSHLLGITTVVIICIVLARRIKEERRDYVEEKLEYDEEQEKLKKEVEEKSNPQDSIDLCYQFHRTYYPNIRYYLHGANAGFCRQMKVVFGKS